MEILQPGYRIGDRILRPARVAVAEPEPEATRPEPEVRRALSLSKGAPTQQMNQARASRMPTRISSDFCYARQRETVCGTSAHCQ